MVDIVGIGVSGLTAYQKSLATVGNNIANLQTDGYVRQRSIIESAGQDSVSRISLGAGVRFAGIERVYDRFAEENLQRATSDLSAQESLLKELQTLQDTIGSSEAGLHGAFEEFFGAVRGLEVAPASVGARAGFLAAADGVALRFRNLGSSVEGFDQASQSAIDDSINKANSLLQQLAAINKQLANRGSAAEQPMQLLDKRDALLGDLAEQIGVTVSLNDNGGATVYAGESASGAALVEGSAARTISVTFDELDPGRVQFVLDAQSRPTVLPPIRSGIAGGLVSYRSQALGTVVDRLDALALAFGNAVNALHRQGLDAEGRAGGDLFYVGPAFDVQSGANAGTARLGVEIIDASKVAARGYDAKYDEARSLWIVTDIHSNASASGSAAVELDGLRFTFNGGAQAGDSFRIRPSQRPAMTFSTLIREPEEIVTGMRLSIAGALGNLSGISADVSLSGQREATAFRSLSDVLPRGSATGGAATSFATSSKPIAVIESGMRSVVLRSESPGSELAIFTRDGRQIAGPRTGAAVVTVANGFHAGAQYADTYLNRSGSGAYLDQGFIYGTHAVAGAQLDTDGRAVLTPAQLLTGRIDVSAFSQLNSGALRINGVSVATKIPRDGQPNTVVEYAAALNALRASTGVQAQVKSEIRVAVPVTNDPFSVSINGRSFSSATVSGLLAAINADPGLPTIEARLESAATSSLDGRALKPEIVIADTGGSDIALGSNNLGLAPGAYGAQLEFKTYQQVAVTSSAVPISASLTVNGVTIERTAPAGETASQRASGLAAKINAAAIGVQAAIVGSDLVLRNIDSQAGSPFTVGANNVGIEAAEYFDDSPLTIDFDPQVVGASSASLRQLGIQPGFVMDSALAEDLLVFGVDGSGEAAAISLSGSFDTGTPPANLASDRRQYVLTFAEANSYTITDSDTGTAVASGVFDLAERKISYGTWQVTLGGIPANGDAFTVSPNADPRGDNRMAAAIARLQDNKQLLGNDQTVQQEYENIVDRVGALAVQAEIGRDATRVVKDYAREARERVSGVNLDEELADLLRYQQAYQANAQVIQAASRIFDALLQRL